MKAFKPGGQEDRVLKVLQMASEGGTGWKNCDGWVNGQYFLREMFLSQYHRALHNLENAGGIEIEHSKFKDSFGFISYRLKRKNTLF